MAHASATLDIPASADNVWQLVGGFDSLPDWLPFIPKSELSEGGRVRTLQTPDGDTIIERLEGFDNDGRWYSYSITKAPFPVTGYRATLRVEVLGSSGTARVTWSADFTPNGVSEEEAVELFDGIFTGGLEAMKANFAG
ncbi:SRPBCC family protein [Pseudomonas sp. NPDC088368]|uniref:SRPBCC family protein n=1 Tax=Pseudomonas sp. NPDC088368 TaxID=3364453 RepID=UPI0037F2F2F4